MNSSQIRKVSEEYFLYLSGIKRAARYRAALSPADSQMVFFDNFLDRLALTQFGNISLRKAKPCQPNAHYPAHLLQFVCRWKFVIELATAPAGANGAAEGGSIQRVFSKIFELR
jgi:hypothetical protein